MLKQTIFFLVFLTVVSVSYALIDGPNDIIWIISDGMTSNYTDVLISEINGETPIGYSNDSNNIIEAGFLYKLRANETANVTTLFFPLLIINLSAVPDYTSACINWNCSEPCNTSFNMFLSSSRDVVWWGLLNNTFSVSHQVCLLNLTSSTTYYINLTVWNSTVLPGMCYQESSNVSTSCGGLSGGNYSVAGNTWFCECPFGSGFNPVVFPSNSIDGLWDDLCSCTSNDPVMTGNISIAYQKPTCALNSSKWQIRNSDYYGNVSIPQQCWNYTSDVIYLKLFSGTMGDTNLSVFCNSSVGETRIAELSVSDPSIVEEAMWWNLSDCDGPGKNATNNTFNFTTLTPAPPGGGGGAGGGEYLFVHNESGNMSNVYAYEPPPIHELGKGERVMDLLSYGARLMPNYPIYGVILLLFLLFLLTFFILYYKPIFNVPIYALILFFTSFFMGFTRQSILAWGARIFPSAAVYGSILLFLLVTVTSLMIMYYRPVFLLPIYIFSVLLGVFFTGLTRQDLLYYGAKLVPDYPIYGTIAILLVTFIILYFIGYRLNMIMKERIEEYNKNRRNERWMQKQS